MADTQVVMQVPKEIIDAQVRSAVAQALAKDPAALVRTIVEAALNEKDPRSYSNKPIWIDALNKMIRDEAQACIAEWIETQRPAIRKACHEKLGTQGRKIIAGIADQLAEKVKTGFHVSISFRDQ